MFNIDRFNYLDVVLICGLPGSGKTHFSIEQFKNTGYKRVNRSEIRKLMFEMTNFGNKWESNKYDEAQEALVKYIEYKIFEEILRNDGKVLIDNISVTKASRKSYINFIKKMDKSIGCIFLNTPHQICIERNRVNTSIPENVLINLYAKLELPKEDEGFDEIVVL